jgi:hypothetical protein
MTAKEKLASEEVEVTRAGRWWTAHRPGLVYSQGRSRAEALANLPTVAEHEKARARVARRPWIRAILDTKLREEIVRVVLTRQAIDERDVSAMGRKELARIDVETRAAFEAVRAGQTGRRTLRRVEDVKDWLDDVIQAPVIAALVREHDRHPERAMTSAQWAEQRGIDLSSRRRGRK